MPGLLGRGKAGTHGSPPLTARQLGQDPQDLGQSPRGLPAPQHEVRGAMLGVSGRGGS